MLEIPVVIADDHPIVLLGVRELILRDSRFKLVAEATSSSQLITALTEQVPELLITDFCMPGDTTYGDGLKLIEYIARRFPKTTIVVLTMVSNHLILSRLDELGVAYVIQKNHLDKEIQTALNTLAMRRHQKQSVNRQAARRNSLDVDERFASLSLREIEVLRLFVAGNSVSEIARLLNRSVKTVSTQKISSMRKLEISNDQELIAYCINTGQFQ